MRAFNLLPVLLFVCVFCNAQNVNLEWNKKFNNKSEATDLKVKADSEGYIYLAGTFYGDSINGNDGVLTKLAPNKDSVFSVVLRGTSAGEDKVNGLAFDENDNSYVAGSFKTKRGNYTPGVVKVNNEGVLKWHYYATSYGENFNEAVKVIAVSSNEIYVCGTYFIDEGQTGVFIQKLDSSGTVEWNYNYANEGLNKIADFAIGTDNMVVLAGNKQVNESVYDAFMIKLDAEGEAICERMLSDVAGMDVFISAMAAGDGAYYMAGNTGDKDYFTIRLNGNGDLEWYATYDGEGLDDIATGVVCVNGNVAVCGTAETEEYSNGINKDIVVILYNQDGEQVWLQRFNSNNDGNDYATGIKVNAVNEDELLVCGMTSTEDQLNNAYILCYSADGEVIWSIGYNDEENRDNITSDFDVDFLGNVYVGMNSVNAENVKGELIKLNQPEKVIVVLKNFLKLITIGMLDASTNATVKAQVNKMCALTVDSFFHVSFKTLIDSCIANGYNLKQEMNEKIADYHSWDASNYVDYIFKRFWVMGNRYNVLLAIPHYSHFDTTALNDDAKLSYEYDETDYPIQCLNCAGGTIDKAGTESNVTWTILTTPRPHYYINGDPTVYLTSCSGVLYTAIGDRCRVCPPSTPGPIIEGQGSSTGHIEIEIKIGDFGLPGTDQCYYSYNTYPTFYDPNPMPTPVYARLSKVGDMPYYVPTYPTLAADECYRLEKVQHPIYDREIILHN
ncbi:MAG: hypothetical protein IPJ79_08200 [Bacteroidetes bacterium]|nr:hypothetical protein [Bacteroidota bacterium]